MVHQAVKTRRLAAMTTIPANKAMVVTLSSGSYLRAIGSSSRSEMYTHHAADQPKQDGVGEGRDACSRG